MSQPGVTLELSVDKLSDDETIVDFRHPCGGLDGIYRRSLGNYTITNVDVEGKFRRRGIGKLMLEAAKDHARTIGADRVISAITSRECLDAMRAVFGNQYIEVTNEGTYHPIEEFGKNAQGDTQAVLVYPLD